MVARCGEATACRAHWRSRVGGVMEDAPCEARPLGLASVSTCICLIVLGTCMCRRHPYAHPEAAMPGAGIVPGAGIGPIAVPSEMKRA